MFGEELPPWDSDRKYHPQNLQLYFEDKEKETLYQVNPEAPLLEVLQHKRFFVKAGSPSFIVLVTGSSFRKQFITGKKTPNKLTGLHIPSDLGKPNQEELESTAGGMRYLEYLPSYLRDLISGKWQTKDG
ncbi:unnamed protein product [Pleuronectes platessa]|uniref:Cns1/TTC4 wheel domain-containing protein n=1 Tax=Pleuronectes platessa TaxID=8262 RepID=A0A9N7ULN8_PLEPL|nr:unnamed protein product [Pleuronectes platessa]